MGKRRRGAANARGRVSLTNGMKLDPAHMKRHGRPTLPEAPGPSYTDPALGKRRGANNHIAKLPISERLAVIQLARLKPAELANVLVDLGILPDQSGKCSECKTGTVKLAERPGQGSESTIGTCDIAPPGSLCGAVTTGIARSGTSTWTPRALCETCSATAQWRRGGRSWP